MTTYTETQLATRVLKDLGLCGVDETPSADELADAIEIIGSEIPQMAVRGIPIWNGSELSIPQEYLTALSRRLGLSVGPSYGVFPLAQAIQGVQPAESLLLDLTAEAPTGADDAGTYY